MHINCDQAGCDGQRDGLTGALGVQPRPRPRQMTADGGGRDAQVATGFQFGATMGDEGQASELARSESGERVGFRHGVILP